MLDHDIKTTIESALAPFLEEYTIDLVELNLNRYRNRLTVDVIVDIPSGGISIAQCAAANRFLNHLLEENGWITDDYIVEVSSPGLDRPLKSVQDFRRAQGRAVAVYLKSNDQGFKLEYRGILQSAADADIVIDQIPVGVEAVGRSKKAMVSKGTITVPIELINKGMQVI